MKITLLGDPRTKKNSPRAYHGVVLPSEAFEQYQEDCLWQIRRPAKPIDTPVNLCCVYFMKTHRIVDLVNLLGATCDILVKAGVLLDDNSRIVVSHDGSYVTYDKSNPRVEILIEPKEDQP